MRQGQNSKRHRGSRSNGRRHQHGMSSNYDSNGPDVKIKGTASQVQDRYQVLARDALSMGNRVVAENYYQHAEHYQRIINANLAATAEANAQVRPNGGDGQPRTDAQPLQPAQPRVEGQPRSEAQPAQPRNEAPEPKDSKESKESKPNGRGRGRAAQRAPEAVESSAAKAPAKDKAAEKTAPDTSSATDGDDAKDSASSANA